MELWAALALFVAAVQGGSALAGEYFKADPLQMMLWMRLLCSVILLPLIPLFPLPGDPLYYVYVAASALIFAYFDVVYIGVAARSGAGVITRLDPLIVGGAFLLWFAVSPSLFFDYIEKPLRAAGIVAALSAGIYFALRLKRCPVSVQALRTALPALILASAGVVLGGLAMERAESMQGSYYYALLQSLIVAVLYLLAIPVCRARTGGLPPFFSRRVFLAGACAAITWVLAVPAKWYAVSLVENPAYISMIGQTTPLWILLIYRLAGRREKADVLSGLGIVASAAMLIIFTKL